MKFRPIRSVMLSIWYNTFILFAHTRYPHDCPSFIAGLDFDGLYRISGNQAQIQKLRYLVDSTDDYNLAEYDVNVLTGALKLFFRELKEPLIPFKLYNILSDTISKSIGLIIGIAGYISTAAK